MIRNEEIRQKYPFLGKGLNDFLKLSELRVVAFTSFAKENEKTVATLWMWSAKTYFSQHKQVAITLS